MALTRSQKATQLTELKEKMQKAKSVMFTQYIGLTVTDISKLRARLREGKAEMKVCKKNLIRLASKEINGPDIQEEYLNGAVACIFSNEDPSAGPGITFKFSKENAKVKLIGGIFDGKLLTTTEALTFASLPSKQMLLTMFVSLCNAPLTQFVSACNGPLTSFARALSEKAKKQPPAPVAAETVATVPVAPTQETPAAAVVTSSAA